MPLAFSGFYAGYEHPYGAFVTFPSGAVTEDPASRVENGPASEARTNTVVKPVLHGNGGPTFDSAAGRWVPTWPDLVSPDGASYTYAQAVGPDIGTPGTPIQVRVVTVATAADRVLNTGGTQDVPIKFATEGIYVVQTRWESNSVGLRLVDPRSGSVRVIAGAGGWDFISQGAAWGVDADIQGVQYNPHSVDRLDLATGAVTRWYDAPEPRAVGPVGLDSNGRPVISVSWVVPASSLWMEEIDRLGGPGQAEQLIPAAAAPDIKEFALSDTHGMWLLGDGGLWLYADGVGLRFVATTAGRPVGACR